MTGHHAVCHGDFEHPGGGATLLLHLGSRHIPDLGDHEDDVARHALHLAPVNVLGDDRASYFFKVMIEGL